MGDVIFLNEQKSAEVSASGAKFLIGAMYEENFGALLPFIRDMEVTDINWNGKDLWIDDVSRGRYNAGVKLDKDFVDAFCIRVANVVSRTFNKYYPRLEAETDDLRITVIHHSVSHTGTTISIRKTPVVKRITFAKSIKEDYYCPEEVANILSNAVKAKFNIVIGGLPGVGKTELVKYLTNYIFPRDRVITIEDTMEIHYSKINPNKDCVELKVDDKVFTYTDAIKSCLRLLPQWILLSEARSKEVQYLLESISTGAKCITTVHTDDMRKVPKRVVNMMGDMDNSALAEQMAYSYFDLGVLVDRVQDAETGKISRFIAQVVMYYEDKGEYGCSVLYDRGKLTGEPIPHEALLQFNRMGIADPWRYTFIQDTANVPDDSTGFLDDGVDDGLSVVDDTMGLTGRSTSRYMDDTDEQEGVESGSGGHEDKWWTDRFDSTGETSRETTDEDADEFSEEPTGYFGENEGSDEEEAPTGYVEGEEAPTGYVDEVEVGDEVPTGYVEEEGYVGVGDEAPTGYVGEDEVGEEEVPTGYVEEEFDEEATGSVEEPDDDDEAPTGFVEEEEGFDEEATGTIEEDDATGIIEEEPKKKSGGRRNRSKK